MFIDFPRIQVILSLVKTPPNNYHTKQNKSYFFRSTHQ